MNTILKKIKSRPRKQKSNPEPNPYSFNGASEDFSAESNKLYPEDRSAHEWYRFVLSFPPHLVRGYLQKFQITPDHLVLDPFCGTGTTIVECKKLGIPSAGIEANPMAGFASRVKVDWAPDPDGLLRHALSIAEETVKELESEGITDDASPLFRPSRITKPQQLRTLQPDSLRLLLTNSISPLPLHKTLVLLDWIEKFRDERYYPHERLALAKALVYSISNLHFGPEVGIGLVKIDAPVVDLWLRNIRSMVEDLRTLRSLPAKQSVVYVSDSRRIGEVIRRNSVDAVITSPPYPNEKDYTRTTRLESVLLGFISDKSALRELKRTLVRSNTRNVYKGDDDDRWVSKNPAVQRIADAIEKRRISMGKTSGFERLYPKVAKLYFGGMARHFDELRAVLRPGARLAYVVGDQASYLRIMIRTGQLLAEIAKNLGYELEGIDLFRTRLATATREQLREEVVILRWPGKVGCRKSCKK